MYLLSAVRCSTTSSRFGIVLHGAADEADLGPRLALEVENLLAPIAHVDHRLARVVLGDELAVLRRDAEAEHARPGVVDA